MKSEGPDNQEPGDVSPRSCATFNTKSLGDSLRGLTSPGSWDAVFASHSGGDHSANGAC